MSIEAPVLTQLEFNKEFFVYNDASLSVSRHSMSMIYFQVLRTSGGHHIDGLILEFVADSR
ncbi:hypothetical protein EPI10_023323 [Gossypium australe]|uniref:Uncharacterized protein n=1 Tax=Gossypium australe TaxID=47621 RepID=A0A5B6VUP4_9ROSI|nr:hypothetical protein EPI10_023323 [Gossypium australe]